MEQIYTVEDFKHGRCEEWQVGHPKPWTGEDWHAGRCEKWQIGTPKPKFLPWTKKDFSIGMCEEWQIGTSKPNYWTGEDYHEGRCSQEQIGKPQSSEVVPIPIPTVPLDPTQSRIDDNSRLEAAIKAQAKLAATGNVQAARALVALTERRAKLLGLDAPATLQLAVYSTDAINQIPTAELERIVTSSD